MQPGMQFDPMFGYNYPPVPYIMPSVPNSPPQGSIHSFRGQQATLSTPPQAFNFPFPHLVTSPPQPLIYHTPSSVYNGGTMPFYTTSPPSNPNSKPPERLNQQPIVITTPEKNQSVLSDPYSPYRHYLNLLHPEAYQSPIQFSPHIQKGLSPQGYYTTPGLKPSIPAERETTVNAEDEIPVTDADATNNQLSTQA